MISYQINLGAPTVDVDIPLASHQDATFHTIKWKFSSVPSSGTYQLYGKLTDGTYEEIPMRSADKSLTDGNRLVFSGSIKGLRFVFTGVSGGAGAVVTLWSYDQYPEVGFPRGVFTGDRALTTQNYIEANVKRGVQYELSSYVEAFPIAPAFTGYVVVTGAKPVTLKGRSINFDGLGLKLETFKDPVYTGGTPYPVYNLNHRNPVASTITVLTGATVTSDGTKVAADKYLIGSNPQGGTAVSFSAVMSEAAGLETILAANSTYYFKNTSLDPEVQKVFSYNTWYEGDTDLP